MKSQICFHNEDISFVLKEKTEIKKWIKKVIQSEKKALGEIHYFFCNDAYLLRLNKDYLNHDTYTDIITFDNSTKREIAADIFISIERVKSNAKKYNVSFENELHRVMIHGILHLVGHRDITNKDKALMRKKEDYYLGMKFRI